MEYIEVSAKTVEDAISEAAIKLEVPSDKIEYEVITEGSTGFLGLIGSKPAVIKARKKFNLLDHTKDFLARMFKAMNVDVNSTVDYDEESRTMNIYERRVIHSVLQNDRYVETHSEGEEPYRKVVITLKKDYRERSPRSGYNREGRYNRENNYNRERGYRRERSYSREEVERPAENNEHNDSNDNV